MKNENDTHSDADKNIQASVQLASVHEPSLKPKLRGFFHQEAFFISIGACAILIAETMSGPHIWPCLIYCFSLLFMFGTSGLYHRVHWEPRQRKLLKRIDHTAIFILIAGSFTPICVITLQNAGGTQLLFLVWAFAGVGLLQSLFWIKASKWISAIIYLIMGWLALPYLSELSQNLEPVQLRLIVWGGILYTVGAVAYALKKPNLKPAIFGYHEFFHVLTIIAAGLHFIVMYQIIV